MKKSDKNWLRSSASIAKQNSTDNSTKSTKGTIVLENNGIDTTPTLMDGVADGITEVQPSLISKHIRNLSRDPFMNLLAALMENGPKSNDIRRLAVEDPLKWGQLVKIFGSLAGYTDRKEVSTDVMITVSNMSNDMLLELERKVDSGEIIDIANL